MYSAMSHTNRADFEILLTRTPNGLANANHERATHRTVLGWPPARLVSTVQDALTIRQACDYVSRRLTGAKWQTVARAEATSQMQDVLMTIFHALKELSLQWHKFSMVRQLVEPDASPSSQMTHQS